MLRLVLQAVVVLLQVLGLGLGLGLVLQVVAYGAKGCGIQWVPGGCACN